MIFGTLGEIRGNLREREEFRINREESLRRLADENAKLRLSARYEIGGAVIEEAQTRAEADSDLDLAIDNQIEAATEAMKTKLVEHLV